MELKDFVKTTLLQLSEALTESSKELGKNVKLTNTELRTTGNGNYGLIEFDLAIEAKNSTSSNKGGGLRISVIEAQLGKNAEQISSSVSRIRFKIEANI